MFACSSPENNPDGQAQNRSGSAPAAAAVAGAPAAPPIQVTAATLRQHFPGANIQFDERSQLPRAIEFITPVLPSQPGASATAIAQSFLNERAGSLFALDTPQNDLRVTSEESDSIEGQRLVHVQQYSAGIPVFGGQIALAVRTGSQAGITRLMSTLTQLRGVDASPGLTQAEAVSRARAAHATAWAQVSPSEKLDEPIDLPSTAGLMFLDPRRVGLDRNPLLTWLVSIGTFRYFLDADDGSLIHTYREFPRALNRKTYECPKQPCTPVLDETGPLVPHVGRDATDLHQFAALAYDYFLKNFGRQGFDGTDITPTTTWAIVQGMNDAHYSPVAKIFRFGSGWAVDDVFVHEYTHAILMHSPWLAYTSDSGAISESLADLFAVFAAPGKAHPWKIGEGIHGSILRDLVAPHGAGFNPSQQFDSKRNNGQPERLSEYVKPTDPICASLPRADDGCVHFNGSILSIAAYGAVAGMAGGKGIGNLKMQQILYSAMKSLAATTPGVPGVPTLADAATAERLMCNAFMNARSFGVTAADCATVDASLKAVGL